jgi:hypothetical protein
MKRIKIITILLLATLVLGVSMQMGQSQVPDVYFATTYTMNWSAIDGSDDPEVWVSIHKSDGTVTHHQITDTSYREYNPSIAIAPNGNMIVAWFDKDRPAPGGLLRYAVLDAFGEPIKPPTTPLSSSAWDEYPCVAVTPNGVVFVVYDDRLADPDVVGYTTMDVNGESVSSKKIIQGTVGDIDRPTVAASIHNPHDNRVVIGWWEDDSGTGADQVAFTILDSMGGTIVPRTMITSTASDKSDVNAAILPNGNAVLVWEDGVSGPDLIGYAIIDKSGAIVDSIKQIISGVGDLRHPAVAATPEGNIVIVWEDRSPTPDVIMYTVLDGEGNPVKGPTSLSDTTKQSIYTDVAVDTNGRAVSIWDSDFRDRVAYAFLDSSGNKLNGPMDLTDGTHDVSMTGDYGTRQVAVKPSLEAASPVGGVVAPVNKLEILAPYVALAGLFAAVSIAVIRRRKA